MSDPSAALCPECGAPWFAEALVCSACHRLRHRDTLSTLSAEATRTEAAGDRSAALSAWRKAMALLPPDTKQHAHISSKVLALSREVDAIAKPAPPKSNARSRGAAALTTAGLFLWKAKIAVLFLLAKAKFLLLGLTKMGTLVSMAVYFGVSYKMYGWQFAAGLVGSIYIHEMGHVAALRRFGIEATAPMFIPGFGALVRLRQLPIEPREDARIGLAGPWWGLGAAVAAWLAAQAFGSPAALAIARSAAWINLFNLIPVWQLDGSRGFRALSRKQRAIVVGVVGLAWLLSRENMLALVLLVGGYRVFDGTAPAEGDRRTLLEFVTLVVVLTGLAYAGS